MPITWFWISGAALALATVLLLVSGCVFAGILGRLVPLLDDTRHQVKDIGDIAVTTVEHAADTMNIVEERVSSAVGQAAASSKSAAGQAVAVGTAITGLYLATRLVSSVIQIWRDKGSKTSKKAGKKRKWPLPG